MKLKIILTAVVLVLIIGLFQWRQAHIARPKAEAVKRGRPGPVVVKPGLEPMVAIVMDDFGYNTNSLAALFAIREPVTLSILPNLPYSTAIAREARATGHEVILHLPLASHRKDVREEMDTINSNMAPGAALARLDAAIASVPGLKGVSNHMGSKATEDFKLMELIFGRLKKDGLYFLDSLTSQRSACKAAAKSAGIVYARRDIFLDNSEDPEYIKKQILAMRKLAFKKGSVIAICHDRRNTVKVLREMMPELAAAGIRFVYLSELVRG